MKKAIIVGASSGIGREVACRLIRDGWQVGLMARREQPLVSLREMADDRVDYALCDVTMPDAPDRLLTLIDRLGGVDLYFHAAGIGSQNLDLESQIEMNTVNTNAVGFCRLVNVVFQYMKKGQTLGKKLLKIRVVDKDTNKPTTIVKGLIRSLFTLNIASGVLNILFIYTLNKTSYFLGYGFVGGLEWLFIIITIFFVLYRKDGRGLHDMMTNTTVIKEGR